MQLGAECIGIQQDESSATAVFSSGRREDYALLLGSLVGFGVLGALMVLIRKVNWAKFGQPVA